MGLTKPRAYQIFDIDYKQSVRVVTISNVTLSGGAPSSVDGVNLSLNDRVLVTGQSTGSQNGLYYVTTVGSGSNGTWARSVDGNETGEIDAGMIVMVTEGTIYADTQWKLTTNDPIVIGATALTFVLNVQANSISSGSSNVVVNANANVTVSSAGTSNVAVFSSTGANITGTLGVSGNITGGNLSGTSITGTLTTAAQTNITSVGTLSSLTVTANVAGGNITTGGVVRATGDVFGKELWSIQSSGDEGGQVNLSIPATNTSLTGQVTIDVYQNQLRFFQGNGARGAYIDLTAAAVGVGTNLLAGGGGGTPGGSNTNVQFNDGGAFGGTEGLTFNKTTNAVATTGTFTATANVAGGNLTTAGQVVATGNITGGNANIAGRIFVGSGTAGLPGVTFSADTSQDTGFYWISDGNIGVSTNGTLRVTFNNTGGIVATGNVTGGNLTTAGQVAATGNINGGNLVVTGNLVDSGALEIITAANGNITLSPNGTGVIVANKDIRNGQANGVGNIGTTGGFFNTIFAKATSAQYADLAEMYVADADYPPGTVVEFGGEYEITISTHSHSTAVAGIVSTNPSYLMNSTQVGEHVLPIALTGRVPCQVQGPVRKGDVLVASSTQGVAQRIGMNWQPGCVVGKSMEVIESNEIRTIEVAVGRL